jgi:hypothetical protein
VKQAIAALGGSGGGGLTKLIKSGNYTMSADEEVYFDTVIAAGTLTLPASPSNGEACYVRDCGNNAGTNNITIARNGKNIRGVAADYTINTDGGHWLGVYNGTDWDYTIISAIPLDYSSSVFRTISGTSDTILESDNGKILIYTNASAIAVTLPDGLSLNHNFRVVRAAAGVPTVTPVTDTINGAGSGIAPSAQWKSAFFTQYASTEWYGDTY